MRERAVPEGGVLLGHTDYRQSPHALPWPERYLESLPCLADPYLRAAYLSSQTSSWEHFTSGYLDQLIAYSEHQFPVSRDTEDVIRALSQGYCQSTFQLSLLACNLGNLARPMNFGDKRARYFKGPSMLVRFFIIIGLIYVLSSKQTSSSRFLRYARLSVTIILWVFMERKIRTKPSMFQVL